MAERSGSEGELPFSEALARTMQASKLLKARLRNLAQIRAWFIIAVLQDRVADVSTAEGGSRSEMTSAPDGIPTLHVANYQLAGHGSPQIGHGSLSLGEFFAHCYSDLPTSQAFHAGFYAGVLAAKQELVDTTKFVSAATGLPSDTALNDSKPPND